MEGDTIRLLRECDAGVKMAVESIDEILEAVYRDTLRRRMTESREAHEKLGAEIRSLLSKHRDEGKDPNLMARGMSWMKTNMKLAMEESDHTAASLVTDGCNMGIKSLHRYLNQFRGADEQSRELTQRLIRLEEQLVEDVRPFL